MVAREHIYLHPDGSWITNSRFECICCIGERVKFIARGVENLLISPYMLNSVNECPFLCATWIQKSIFPPTFFSRFSENVEKKIDSEVFWYGIQKTIIAFQSQYKSLFAVDLFMWNCAPSIRRFRISQLCTLHNGHSGWHIGNRFENNFYQRHRYASMPKYIIAFSLIYTSLFLLFGLNKVRFGYLCTFHLNRKPAA